MKKFAMAICALSLGVASSTGIALAGKGNGNGEGHTPVVVCHWVPAAPHGSHQIPGPEGGSYLVIVVDDDGANGNKKLHAHAGHEYDLIGVDANCGRYGEEE